MSINILALRAKLITMLSTTENEELIKKVFELVRLEKNSIYKFSEEQISAVQEAREQYSQGEYRDAELVDKEILEWLEK